MSWKSAGWSSRIPVSRCPVTSVLLPAAVIVATSYRSAYDVVFFSPGWRWGGSLSHSTLPGAAPPSPGCGGDG